MSFLNLRPAEIRAPELQVLPDNRIRYQRFFAVAHTGEIPPELNIAYGTIDAYVSGETPAAWQDARLVNRQLTDSIPGVQADGRCFVVLTYEEIHATAETQVGLAQRIRLEDGRTAFEYDYIQFASGSYTPGTVGTSTAPDDGSLFLQREEATNDGTLRRIKRTYVAAGTLEQVDDTGNNGALLTRTITAAKTAPSTPSGYTLIRTAARPVNGFPVYTYTFAKGDGEIDRRTSYSQSDDGGTTGVTTVDITHLTASSVGTDPTSSPGIGFVKVSEARADRDGHRVWSVSYVKATGQVTTRYRVRQDGLREVTYVSLGARVAPSGIIIQDDEDLANGYTVFTVTAMQTAAGSGTVAGASIAFERYVPFTYPGRAKAFEESYSSRYMLDVFQSPPITTLVKATVTVSYQTSNSLGTISDFWNPTSWATLRAQWIGLNNEPNNLVRPLPGYRSTSETAVTRTSSSTAPNNVSIFGNIVFGNTTAKITVTGGPADPGGSTYTLSAEIEPAFTATDGTVYYRKTLVSAAIPTQSALPV